MSLQRLNVITGAVSWNREKGAIRGDLDDDESLDALAARAGWSRFHFHRAFRAVTGETPKRYTLRLRLERAAAGC